MQVRSVCDNAVHLKKYLESAELLYILCWIPSLKLCVIEHTTLKACLWMVSIWERESKRSWKLWDVRSTSTVQVCSTRCSIWWCMSVDMPQVPLTSAGFITIYTNRLGKRTLQVDGTVRRYYIHSPVPRPLFGFCPQNHSGVGEEWTYTLKPRAYVIWVWCFRHRRITNHYWACMCVQLNSCLRWIHTKES